MRPKVTAPVRFGAVVEEHHLANLWMLRGQHGRTTGSNELRGMIAALDDAGAAKLMAAGKTEQLNRPVRTTFLVESSHLAKLDALVTQTGSSRSALVRGLLESGLKGAT